MQNIWKKLNLKEHNKMMVLNAPASFEGSISDLQNVVVLRNISTDSDIRFILSYLLLRRRLRYKVLHQSFYLKQREMSSFGLVIRKELPKNIHVISTETPDGNPFKQRALEMSDKLQLMKTEQLYGFVAKNMLKRKESKITHLTSLGNRTCV